MRGGSTADSLLADEGTRESLRARQRADPGARGSSRLARTGTKAEARGWSPKLLHDVEIREWVTENRSGPPGARAHARFHCFSRNGYRPQAARDGCVLGEFRYPPEALCRLRWPRFLC